MPEGQRLVAGDFNVAPDSVKPRGAIFPRREDRAMILCRNPHAGTVQQITIQFPMAGETALLRIRLGAIGRQRQAGQQEGRPAKAPFWFT
jgi:hypothetical protein